MNAAQAGTALLGSRRALAVMAAGGVILPCATLAPDVAQACRQSRSRRAGLPFATPIAATAPQMVLITASAGVGRDVGALVAGWIGRKRQTVTAGDQPGSVTMIAPRSVATTVCSYCTTGAAGWL